MVILHNYVSIRQKGFIVVIRPQLFYMKLSSDSDQPAKPVGSLIEQADARTVQANNPHGRGKHENGGSQHPHR